MELVIKPCEEDVTNGDVICELWNVPVVYENGCYGIIRGEERSSIHWFSEEWWDAPYKSESEDKNDISMVYPQVEGITPTIIEATEVDG